jgi:hypothetical protein
MFFVILAVVAGAALLLKATMDAASLSALPHIKVGEILKEVAESQNPSASTLNNFAQMVSEYGYPATAEAIREKSDIAHALESIPRDLPSPIPGVSSTAWQRFVDLFKGKQISEISPSYQFGLFNIGFRRLADLGLASGVHRGLYQGKSVWFGHFVKPLSMERFLNDPALQYKVFCKDISDRYKLVTTKHQAMIGTPLEGVIITLSGLLAVAKLAGTAGLSSWLVDPLERKKFSQTTAAFIAANGVF